METAFALAFALAFASFNFLASLINGNLLPRLCTHQKNIKPFNFLASLINGNFCFRVFPWLP